MAPVPDQPLRILHAVRAPVGGIFRHILDLANGQADRGHHVGIIADSLTGGAPAEPACPARTCRQSRRLHSPEASLGKNHSRLYTAWRFAALPAEYTEGRTLRPARTDA